MKLKFGIISPQDCGLPVTATSSETDQRGLGVSLAELDRRAQKATNVWLLDQFDQTAGAFFGHYRVPDEYREPPQTVNLIAPWQLLAAYDRSQDPSVLDMARRAAAWFYHRHVVDHPMSVVAGGVRDGIATTHLWTKFGAEEVITCLGLHTRTRETIWLARAEQGGRYLIQARRHGYAPRYDLAADRWLAHGWDSWGRAAEALVLLWQATGDVRWHDEALLWGEHALAIQGTDGAFYLIDDDYYNTDLAADELRALVWLHMITGREDYLRAAIRFADWHLAHQTEAGAWPLTIDRDGNVVMPTVGPGDVPNIGIALLWMHHVTGEERYLNASYAALRYSLSVQVTPDGPHPYSTDRRAQWGFWSWDPYYDYTQSADQSTHHARGMWFLIDYCSALSST